MEVNDKKLSEHFEWLGFKHKNATLFDSAYFDFHSSVVKMIKKHD